MDNNQEPEYLQIKLSNGDEIQAPLLVPISKTSEKLALVDIDVLKRITRNLPTASFKEIQADMNNSINHSTDLKNMVENVEAELNFHKSINLIKEFKITEAKPEELSGPMQ